MEFEVSDSGRTITCPHCGMDTVLYIKYIPKPIVRVVLKQKEPDKTRKNMMLALVIFGLLALISASGLWFYRDRQSKRETAIQAQREASENKAKQQAESQRLASEAQQKADREQALQRSDAAKLILVKDKVINNIYIPAHPYVNSLGMKFVGIPDSGVLFSIWDTRVQDYQVYANANSGVNDTWKYPEFKGAWADPATGIENPPSQREVFKQGSIYPVINVSWNDANAFCQWLTARERTAGKIGDNQCYRLPTDWEWSMAVGIKEAKEDSPANRSKRNDGAYPWGNQQRAPRGAGNYNPHDGIDNYDYTSPVNAFSPNIYGLYDMGGNVWQLCKDRFSGNNYIDKKIYGNSVTLRGSCWLNNSATSRLSGRLLFKPDERDTTVGFRVVLCDE